MVYRVATIAEWEEAIKKEYAKDVSAEEYANKATPNAVRRIAYYMKWTDYDIDRIAWLGGNIMFLFDFLAFTADITYEPTQFPTH